MTLTREHIDAAAQTLARALPPSPLVRVHPWRTAGGARILAKAESLMPTGSFKIRGATWRLATLTPEQKARGVIAYSTGNHAQAVAKAAADQGVRAIVVMSEDVPLAKVEATRAWGAQVVMAEPNSAARRALAESLAHTHGYLLVPPYNDYAVMAGQASIGVELLDQLADDPPDAVFVPVGGGGLLAGVATAIKQRMPSVAVIGVEPELEDDARRSFRAGHLVGLDAPSASIADAIKVQCVGELVFPLIRRHVDDIVTVSEAEIVSAVVRYHDEAHLVVEPGGAVALAAAFADRRERGCVVALACGGNITLERLAALRCTGEFC